MHGLGRLVGFGHRLRVQVRHIVALQHVEPRHRLAERLGAKERAGRRAGRDTAATTTVCAGAADERIQATDRREQRAAGEQSPFEQIAARDLALRIRLHDLAAVFSGILGCLDPRLRRVLGQVDSTHCVLSLRSRPLLPRTCRTAITHNVRQPEAAHRAVASNARFFERFWQFGRSRRRTRNA
jgi:hypothetical protein